MSGIGILLPVPGVLLALSDEDSQYIMFEVTPDFCLSKNSTLAYYSTVLILNLIVMAGVTLLLPIIWTVHKVSASVGISCIPRTYI